eukprot:TRINITY_DN17985_c0_g1_i2.p1 TRINITY_DN17985_c0_g1~~TRINITY_DN17985_c0_g1_i2.p1  ORF type:complete len:129 (+),score=5.14 TRINITY_DN17985_c0_g1_i2:525-911(+)
MTNLDYIKQLFTYCIHFQADSNKQTLTQNPFKIQERRRKFLKFSSFLNLDIFKFFQISNSLRKAEFSMSVKKKGTQKQNNIFNKINSRGRCGAFKQKLFIQKKGESIEQAFHQFFKRYLFWIAGICTK